MSTLTASDKTTSTTTANMPVKATITNGLGFDVDIYDVYNNNLNNPKGLLTYTKLATVKAGASKQEINTIHTASQLQAMRTGPIEALNGRFYRQFPVAVMVVSKLNDSNDFTLTAEQQQGMEQAFNFIKYTQANADAKVAKDFRAALGNTSGQKKAVNDFFATTGSFKQCNLLSWTAVMTWQAQFTSAWQNTYYLYSVVEGAVSKTNQPKLMATVVITSSADREEAKLTMEGSGGQAVQLQMVGDGSMQEQNAGTNSVSVALTPVWMNVAQTSKADGKTSTKYLIGSALTGTINGTKVTGNLNKLDLPDPADADKPSAMDILKLVQSLLGSIFQAAGLLTSVGMLYFMAKQHKESNTQEKNDAEKPTDTKEEVAERNEQIDDKYDAEEVQEVNSQVAEVEEEIPLVKKSYQQVDQGNDAIDKNEMADEEIGKLKETMEENAPTDAVENIAEGLGDVKQSLQEGDVEEASAKLDQVQQDLDTQLTTNAEELQDFEAEALTNTQEAVKEQMAEAKSVEEAQGDRDEDMENNSEDPMEEGTFDEPEVTVEPVGGE